MFWSAIPLFPTIGEASKLKNQRNCAIIPQTWGIYQHTNTCYYMKSAKPSPLKFVPLTSSGV